MWVRLVRTRRGVGGLSESLGGWEVAGTCAERAGREGRDESLKRLTGLRERVGVGQDGTSIGNGCGREESVVESRVERRRGGGFVRVRNAEDQTSKPVLCLQLWTHPPHSRATHT